MGEIDARLTRIGEVEPRHLERRQHGERARGTCDSVESSTKVLEDMAGRRAEAERATADKRRRVGVLEKLAAPSGLEELATNWPRPPPSSRRRKPSNKRRRLVWQGRNRIWQGSQPGRSWNDGRDRRTEFSDLEELLQKSSAVLEETEVEAVEAAGGRRVGAQLFEEAQQAHAAAHLRSGLAVGEECPVCRRPIDELLDEPPPAELEEARRGKDQTADRARRAGLAHAAAEAESKTLVARKDKLADELADALLTRRSRSPWLRSPRPKMSCGAAGKPAPVPPPKSSPPPPAETGTPPKSARQGPSYRPPGVAGRTRPAADRLRGRARQWEQLL